MTTTKTTVEFLDAAKKKHGLTSDYQLSKLLGCAPSAIYNYRAEKSRLDDAAAVKVAELLDLDPAYVMACIHAEREKNAALKKIWKRIAESMAGAAAVALLAVGIFLPGAFGGDPQTLAFVGFTAPVAENFVYYVKCQPLPELAIFAAFLAVFSLWLFAFPAHNSPTTDPDKEPGK